MLNVSLMDATPPPGIYIRFTSPGGGSSQGSGLFNGGYPFWQEANSTYLFSQPQDSVQRWIISSSNVPPTGTITGPINMTLQYSHQYYVAIQSNVAAGGSFSNTSGWYDAGTTVQTTASAGPGWKFEGWNGTGDGAVSGPNNTIRFVAGEGSNRDGRVLLGPEHHRNQQRQYRLPFRHNIRDGPGGHFFRDLRKSDVSRQPDGDADVPPVLV